MKKSGFIVALLIATCLLSAIDSVYHNYEEIKAELDMLASQNPEFMMIDSIGVTHTDSLPIWAMKVSHNVQVDEDLPALLFVGQCHAEEIQGVEVVMKQLELIAQYPTYYENWLNELELWFIPTINPEGLQVVLDEWDVTYRKTKTDVDNNGIFDYNPEGWGNDLDGVDPNRNYAFNWIHGDNLWAQSGEEWYDYYRGPYPFSEGGTDAVRNLAKKQYFIYSINFHSSRSGNFSSKVFYPWRFKNEVSRQNPDFEYCRYIGESVASQIGITGDPGTYEPGPSQGRNGTSTPWFYQAHKTVQLTIEMSGIQPDSTELQLTVNENLKGINWLVEQARNGYQPPCPLLTGHITDAVTGEPLVAQFYIEELEKNYFDPTYSDELYGRFWRPVGNGTYTLVVKKDDYLTYEQQVVVNNSLWTNVEVQLQPLPPAVYSGTLSSDDVALNGTMIIYDVDPDTVFIQNGQFEVSVTPGNNKVEIYAEGYFPIVSNINFLSGEHNIEFEMSEATVYFSDDFNNLDNWTTDGPWEIVEGDKWAESALGEEPWDGAALTDYWGENDPQSFYAPNCDVSIVSAESFHLGNVERRMLHFMENIYVEPYFDYVTISLSSDLETWTEVYSNSEIRPYWKRKYVPLNDFPEGDYYVRLRLQADSPNDQLVDPGWIADDFRIVGGDFSVTVSNEDTDVQPFADALLNNYPNPFNPETNLRFSLSPKTESAYIKVYNVRGELTDKIEFTPKDIKNGKVKWNAEKFASGIYFYQLSADRKVIGTNKMILLK
ncbi:MAG: hypothetical protein CSB55_07340 [Candidatus Cloacimonadota bacterium]|nr:MAG: hypothetical protein CSB55_07340 [Candidatus Cloacimonadota bacterium]